MPHFYANEAGRLPSIEIGGNRIRRFRHRLIRWIAAGDLVLLNARLDASADGTPRFDYIDGGYVSGCRLGAVYVAQLKPDDDAKAADPGK